MENQKTKEQEERFIAWTLARDDDWWEEGYGHFSIWDFRIMQEFFKEEITNALNQQRENFIKAIEETFTWQQRIKPTKKAGTVELVGDSYIHLEWKIWKEFLTKLEE